ncbi:MAG: TIM barrel protein [Chloroflexi bacterium]|nr:TIM barrel protein [Chloroflexota bacterium]
MPLSFRFGTVGSPISTPKKPGGSVGAIIRTRELGLDAFELGWVQSVRVTEKTCADIRATAKEHDVLLSVHAPYFINLNADKDEWPKSRKRLMDAAHYGDLAGATEIIFHPGTYFGNPPAEVLPIAIERLQGCVDELRRAGNQATLRPETMGKQAQLGTLDDALKMAKAIKGVLPCVDFAHLHARRGDGSLNTTEEWRAELETYRKTLGEKSLKNLSCHISGIEYTEKGEKNHLPAREADLNVKALFRALHDLGCGGRMLCESPEMENDALYYKETWIKVTGERE